jgi:hypothetical protein
MSDQAKDVLVEMLGVANPEVRSGDPSQWSDQVRYTSVDWVVRAGAEAAFVAEVEAFRRWLLGQRGGWFVLLQDASDLSRFTSFGVFADTGLVGPRPALAERLARVQALCESSLGRTYTVAAAGRETPLKGVERNGDALSPVEVS